MLTIHCSVGWRVLLEQFMLHTLWPLSGVWLSVTGKHLHEKQGFTARAPFPWLLTIFVPCAQLAAIGLFAVYKRQLNEDGIQDEEFAGAVLITLVRYLLISTKYSLLRPEEYQRFKDETDAKRATRWRLEIQLLSGWVVPPRVVVDNQLRIGAQLHDLDLSETYVEVDTSDPKQGNWSKLLDLLPERAAAADGDGSAPGVAEVPLQPHREPKPADDAVIHVTSADLSSAVVLSTIDVASLSQLRWAGVVMAVIRCLLPRLSSLVLPGVPAFPRSAIGLVYLVLEVLVVFLQYQVAVQLFCASMLHYKRQHDLMALIGRLIRPHPHEYPGFPRLDMSNPVNVRGWTHARIAFQHFGARYGQRIKVYTAASFVFLLTGVAGTIFITAVADDRFSALNSAFTYATIQDILLMGTVLCVSTIYGSLSNQQVHKHRASLTHHLVDLRHKASELQRKGQHVSAEHERAERLLDMSASLLNSLDSAYAITVLGVRAEPSLVTT